MTSGRSTRQRRAVESVLDSCSDFRTAQELHEALQRAGDPVGLATVYRTLTSLAEAGEVDVVKTDGGEAVYRRCSDSHHHHLVCRRCGRTEEIRGPAVEQWASTMATEHGYAEVRHTVELFGLCPECQRAPGTGEG